MVRISVPSDGTGYDIPSGNLASEMVFGSLNGHCRCLRGQVYDVLCHKA